ncbi:MAG: hypothetical protein MK116_08240 [Phycisphaerales bacterium]|nr:hypothetical protein [Phycisphaerales bacterium]
MTGSPGLRSESPAGSTSWTWITVSIIVVLVAIFGVRWGSGVLDKGPTWDEKYILIPIRDLIEKGWSVETAIDFQEAKGPAMIWPYAIWGAAAGDSLNTIRLLSVFCFILTLVPLLVLAGRCGLPPPTWPLVAVGLILLPFELVLCELVMGEPSYVLGVACLLAAVLWGAGDRDHVAARVAGPVIYGILLVILLHSRVHVVPIAGGVCLAMAWRDGHRSWPWWVASIIAGLLRIPLWMRWGGLVSPLYQDMHGFGLRLESLTYLGATFAIPFAVFLLVWFWRYRFLCWWFLAPLGMFIGLLLGVFASPDLVDPHTWGEVRADSLFQGPTRSLVMAVAGAESAHWIVITILSMVGLGGLGALGAMALEERCDQPTATLARIQFFTMFCAWGLYMFTQGYVFDRFLLAWTIAMPVLWVKMLPRWTWGLQMIAMAAILAGSASRWLW